MSETIYCQVLCRVSSERAPSEEEVSEFLDGWIEKIESLDLLFGGGTNWKENTLEGVVQIDDLSQSEIETKMRDLRSWLDGYKTHPDVITFKLVTEDELLADYDDD